MTLRARYAGAVLLALVIAGQASAATTTRHEVAVIVVPRFAPSAYAERGAVGWLIPGAGLFAHEERPEQVANALLPVLTAPR